MSADLHFTIIFFPPALLGIDPYWVLTPFRFHFSKVFCLYIFKFLFFRVLFIWFCLFSCFVNYIWLESEFLNQWGRDLIGISDNHKNYIFVLSPSILFLYSLLFFYPSFLFSLFLFTWIKLLFHFFNNFCFLAPTQA